MFAFWYLCALHAISVYMFGVLYFHLYEVCSEHSTWMWYAKLRSVSPTEWWFDETDLCRTCRTNQPYKNVWNFNPCQSLSKSKIVLLVMYSMDLRQTSLLEPFHGFHFRSVSTIPHTQKRITPLCWHCNLAYEMQHPSHKILLLSLFKK